MHFTDSNLTYFNHLYNDQFATNTIDIVLKFYSDYFKRNRVCRNIVTSSVLLWFVVITCILYQTMRLFVVHDMY